MTGLPRAILLSALVACAGAARAADADPVSVAISRVLRETRAPGAACAWVPDSGDARRWLVGHEDAAATRPLDDGLRWPLASAGKLFAGNLVLQLAAEGVIDLDASVRGYLPELPADLTPLTVRQAGRHASGLADPVGLASFRAEVLKNPARAWTNDELLAVSLAAPRVARPGKAFRYGNINTILLARIAEAATGDTWENLLRTRVSAPFGLSATAPVGAQGMAAPHARGHRHARQGNPFGYGRVFTDVTGFSPAWAGAGGHLMTTLADMERCARVLCTGENLPPAQRDELLRLGPPDRSGARYGFHLAEYDGRLIGHAGDVPGWSAFVARPGARAGTVIVFVNLSNTIDGRHPATLVAEALLAALPEP